ncbi:MAG: YggS family pyridoxal phosphate-dependent enzyme [Streptosporangiales bacterium]|nr:YggS family pyridoxal phosphate-dependent enzyme [Streptosporangiales bacterium]
MSDSRDDEIAAGLARVRARVAAACVAAGRSEADVRIIGVTKNHPASDVRCLAALGVTDVGENRAQEAEAKALEVDDPKVTWHFVGALQTNKARSVVRFADVVHSVDRRKLVAALGREAVRADREITALIQVNLAPGTPGVIGERSGAVPGEVPGLAAAVAETAGLRLGGVMAVAPLGEEAGAAFERLASTAERLRVEHPDATMVSAGMSGDLEAAVAHGATHLRIGTALLGDRGPIVR